VSAFNENTVEQAALQDALLPKLLSGDLKLEKPKNQSQT